MKIKASILLLATLLAFTSCTENLSNLTPQQRTELTITEKVFRDQISRFSGFQHYYITSYITELQRPFIKRFQDTRKPITIANQFLKSKNVVYFEVQKITWINSNTAKVEANYSIPPTPRLLMEYLVTLKNGRWEPRLISEFPEDPYHPGPEFTLTQPDQPDSEQTPPSIIDTTP